MSKSELEKIISYLVERGLETIKNQAEGVEAKIDYVAIFSRDENEYQELELAAQPLGVEVDQEVSKTGKTFLLSEPINTAAGVLSLIKIRKSDATRPQRGAPDFKIQNYQEFKEKYLATSGNFTLMVRRDYEMIEIKGVDVLVYIPSQTLTERMK